MSSANGPEHQKIKQSTCYVHTHFWQPKFNDHEPSDGPTMIEIVLALTPHYTLVRCNSITNNGIFYSENPMYLFTYQ